MSRSRVNDERGTRHVRRDALTVIVLGVIAAVSVITLAILKYLDVFVPGGIAWTIPIEAQPGTGEGHMPFGPDGPVSAEPVTGTFTQLDVVIPTLDGVSTAFLATAIALTALAALAVIACTARVAWLFLRGRFFTTQSSRALRTLNVSLAGGAFAAFAFWHQGANGVEAALNVRASPNGSVEWWSWYWIVLFAVVSLGLVDIALRRGIRLENDTEGLV